MSIGEAALRACMRSVLHEIRDRARSAREASYDAYSERAAAALRGKAVGYTQAADLVEAALNRRDPDFTVRNDPTFVMPDITADDEADSVSAPVPVQTQEEK